ncbi:MAG: hypothetical protein IPP32_15775 [Bacteroidetes bacterium]|nr:hypothetical protein [Bacteroidota bacterium]
MRSRIVFLIGLFCCIFFSQPANAQPYKGLYVDGFDKILGKRPLEDQLLNYCKKNGFNALCTYKTKDIEKQIQISNPKTGGKILASFIKRAKQQYGIISFAMSSEQYDTFNTIIAKYNRTRTDTIERVNVLNFEFEYWNRKSTAPGGYYCTRYLMPTNCSCDTSGAFKFYRVQMFRIDSLAQALGIKSEVYVGKPSRGQAKVIANTVDRILVDVYLKNPEKAYDRAQERLHSFAAVSKKVTIIPIWGSTGEFLGEWQQEHAQDEANKIFLDEYNAKKTELLDHINVAGFQWYKYSTMKK